MRKELIRFSIISIFTSVLLLSGCKNKDNGNEAVTQEPQQPVTTETQTTATPAPTEIAEALEPAEIADVTYTRVSVHDPSVIKTDGSYYIFGSHMAWAKSDDLMHWSTYKNNINSDYNKLLGDLWKDYCRTDSNPNLNGNLWAPDVIYNETMKKYCLYMSVNGDDWNSVIALLTADKIEGPYEYAGAVVYSGFNTTSHPVEKTDVYKVLGNKADLSRYQSINDTKINAIDPNLRYDDEGNLWMSFGSWFGGIYMLKLDAETGLRDYTYTYATEKNVSDEYYGYKIAGGNAVSGEGPYILKAGDYYYLFVSYGGLSAEDGYQIRVFRSKDITGPYVDQNGESAVYKRNMNNLTSKIGIRLMGSYQLSGNYDTHVAQGHNSVFTDDDGKILLVYHTRFAGGKNGIKEAHQVRVQQLFINEDNWLIAAPYEYSGETLAESGYSKEEMTGSYEFIVHTPNTFYHDYGSIVAGIAENKNISLKEDGSVSGDLTGTWRYKEGTADMSIIIDGVEYRGKFIKQATENKHRIVMTFTALGENVCVWGSKK
ncbi:glycoside hydrolase family 43 protein [Anaerocolumna sp. AGMB13020]|uniref:glycoside hydrolase family 43 protein n=1 Tax=Anaerocolumna sp. AGMB13020 TaxID=3081750 RepID=UPI002954774B|nr:glycoside hydrolase family 43 protein [Anaerocolumna sp. AGMB13020]WOO37071.1 glycoside hydrolase family 43 protein [Anaerocolumna sp. AGMB13020]